MSENYPLPSRSIRGLAETLASLKIDYALVGGVAVALMARPRFTADVDAVLLDVDDRLEWLIHKMSEAGYAARAQDQLDFARRNRVLTLRDSFEVNVDLMLGLLPFDVELVARGEKVLLEGTEIVVANPQFLLVMKAVAWRPKDLDDLVELAAINPDIDREFVLETFAEYAEFYVEGQ